MIKIFNRDDFSFPQPLYGFGQTVYTEQGEEAFILGMKTDGDGWMYELFYIELGVIGSEWIKETQLSGDRTVEG